MTGKDLTEGKVYEYGGTHNLRKMYVVYVQKRAGEAGTISNTYRYQFRIVGKKNYSLSNAEYAWVSEKFVLGLWESDNLMQLKYGAR